jgi:hypothetical protein
LREIKTTCSLVHLSTRSLIIMSIR